MIETYYCVPLTNIHVKHAVILLRAPPAGQANNALTCYVAEKKLKVLSERTLIRWIWFTHHCEHEVLSLPRPQ